MPHPMIKNDDAPITWTRIAVVAGVWLAMCAAALALLLLWFAMPPALPVEEHPEALVILWMLSSASLVWPASAIVERIRPRSPSCSISRRIKLGCPCRPETAR